MGNQNPKILLVATSPADVTALTTRFKRWECEIQFASSCAEAIELVRTKPFDLVLSEFKLSGGGSSPLAESLLGSNSTLIYSYPVETRCWWLFAVKNGRSCWGSPALRTEEFLTFVEDFLTVIRLRQEVLADEPRETLFELAPERNEGEKVARKRQRSAPEQSSVDAA